MRFSILHISDLHRDLHDEIPNEWLLDSLSRDFDQFDKQEPKILKPSICIVSGDLVFGAAPHAENSDRELIQQYSQVEEFLVGLADRFFGGNRESVVILPGNHDVCLYDVMRSLQKVEIPAEPEKKRLLVKELFQPNSKMRWSWSDLCFFKIIDNAIYKERFRYFAKMYEHFYQNRRKFSFEADEQFSIFDFPHLNFCVATLNSCLNNDPLHTVGAIHPNALTNACRELKKTERLGWLSAAAWHHNIVGGPTKNDYIDAEFIQPLIDAGVSLGFHGHQNYSDCFDERYRLGQNSRKITIISASTLCDEPRNLNPGVPRSYNIVEIDTDDWSGKIHQRQMVNKQFNMPIWGPGHFTQTSKSYFDIEFCPPLRMRPAQLDLQLTLERVDNLTRSNKLSEALEILETIKEDSLARVLLVGVLEELGDNRHTINTLWPPLTNREVVTLGGAVLECGTQKEAEDFIRLDIVSTNTDASVGEIRRRMKERCRK